MSLQAIILSTSFPELGQRTLRLQLAIIYNRTEGTYLMFKSDIKIILQSLTELLTIFLVFPHPSYSSRDLGVRLIHTSLQSFVE